MCSLKPAGYPGICSTQQQNEQHIFAGAIPRQPAAAVFNLEELQK